MVLGFGAHMVRIRYAGPIESAFDVLGASMNRISASNSMIAWSASRSRGDQIAKIDCENPRIERRQSWYMVNSR